VSKADFENTRVRFQLQKFKSTLVNSQRLHRHHPEQQSAYKAAGMCGLSRNEFRTAQLFALRVAR